MYHSPSISARIARVTLRRLQTGWLSSVANVVHKSLNWSLRTSWTKRNAPAARRVVRSDNGAGTHSLGRRDNAGTQRRVLPGMGGRDIGTVPGWGGKVDPGFHGSAGKAPKRWIKYRLFGVVKEITVPWCSIPGGAYEAIKAHETVRFDLRTKTFTPSGDEVQAFQILGWRDVWD